LSQIKTHRVRSGETLDHIAKRYNLIPATILGFNPDLQHQRMQVGMTLAIPPYNGIRVAVSPGQSWREIAARYEVRADVLFEVNGCRPPSQVAFIPGVNWSPARSQNQPWLAPQMGNKRFPTPPLSAPTSVQLKYGWQIVPSTGAAAFHSGVDLGATVGTAVQAAEPGTVAFAGAQGVYGNLVVINHQGGWQTRYAQLGTIAVKTGDWVEAGQIVGKVGTTGRPSSTQPHLHFEVRYRSSFGWVAEDPMVYLPASAILRQL
jgi:lysostaphin